MRHLLTSFLLLTSITFCTAQCEFIGSVVSFSNDTSVQMYSPAFYLVLPASANEISWELSTLNGVLLTSSVTTENLSLLSFNVPLSDSLIICQTVSNSISNEVCQLCDTLSFGGDIVHWELITSNTGILTSLPEHNALDVSIYPNPVGAQLNIMNKAVISRVELINEAGQILLSSTEASIDVSALSPGAYFIKAYSENAVASQKFIKE